MYQRVLGVCQAYIPSTICYLRVDTLLRGNFLSKFTFFIARLVVFRILARN